MDATAPALAYVWEVPGQPISVVLSLEVVDRLNLAVLEGFHALPRRGLEIGGLLLGRVKRNGKLTSVEVDDFDAVESEHTVGPSYLLSASDRATIEQHIRWHKSKGKLSIVGFFRSNTRKEFAATLEDLDFLSSYFPGVSDVFLLIHPRPDAVPRAAFFIWEGRKIRSRTPHLEFPFRSTALMAGAYEIVARGGPKARPVSQALTERVNKTVRAAVNGPLAALAGARTMGLKPSLKLSLPRPGIPAAALAGIFRLSKAERPAAPVGRADPASREPGPLRALAVAANKRARIFPLLRKAVPSSKLGWTIAACILAIVASAVVPRRNEPATRPTVAQPPQTTVTASAPSVVATSPATPGLAMSQAAAPAPDIVATLITGPVSTPSNASTTASAHRGNASRESLRAMAELPQVQLESAFAPDPPASELAGPPAAEPAFNQAVLRALISRANDALSEEIPEVADPLVSVAVDPVPEWHRGGLLHKLGFTTGRVTPPNFVPPAPVHEAQAEIPPEVRHHMKHAISIEVKVYIDQAGNVEYAELLSKGTGSNRDLASLAVFSSRHWQFSPARIGDETVPGEVILRFRFGPEH